MAHIKRHSYSRQQNTALRSSKASVHYQLAKVPVLHNPDARPSQEETLQEPEPPQADNLVAEYDNVFYPQVQEPDLELLVPPFRCNMAEARTLLPGSFSGYPKEDATEFWRRLETYLEYKGNDNTDKLCMFNSEGLARKPTRKAYRYVRTSQISVC